MGRVNTAVSYWEVLEGAREIVREGLEQVQQTMVEVAQGAPGRLSESLGLLLNRRGKRIRSTFLLLMATTREKSGWERAVRVASALELIHLASLVHDDIIDDSDLRRNEKTAHKRWGNRTAVLLGDYALAKSMEMVWQEKDSRIPLSLSRASSNLIRGEVLEVEQAGNTELTLEQYFTVIEGKTAALMEACGECGAILADLDGDLIVAGSELGRNFGVAFQIIDDLLDFGYGAQNLDKKTFSDVKNGFFTLPFILYFSGCSLQERDEMRDLLREPESENNQKIITRKLDEHLSFSQARDMALDRIRTCLGLLERFPESPSTVHLRNLCEMMTDRSN